MAQAVARAKYIRIAPRKVRLVADLIRGKKVADARDLLTVTIKGAAPVVGKVLAAAVANAESAAAESRERVDTDEMTVSEIMVDEGRTMKGFRPAARGRAAKIRKRSSHIHLVISD